MSPQTLFLLIVGCLMLQPLSTDLYLASLPQLGSHFGATPAGVQQTLSLFVIGFGTAQLISGPLSDRFGRRPVALAGLGIYVCASVACSLAQTLPVLVAGRFVQAVGCCTAVVVARAIIRDAYAPSEGAKMMAKASAFLSLAPLLGPIIGSHLQVNFGWRAAFVALTIVGLAVTIAVLARLDETIPQCNPGATRLGPLLRSYAHIAATPGFWAYALPGALSYAAIFCFISGSSYALIQVLGVPTEYFGYGFAFGVCGYLAGALICRRLLARIGQERTLTVGASTSLAAGLGFLAAIMAGWQHWSVVLLAQFFTMAAHGINFPATQTGSLAPFPRQAGTAAGLFGFLTMAVAFAAGSWLGAHQDGSLQPLAEVTAAICVTLFACAALLVKHRRPGTSG